MVSQDNSITVNIFQYSKEVVLQIPLSDKIGKNILFSINEYDEAELTNNSNIYDIFVENLEDGGETKLSCGEKININYNDHPYPPMEYRLRVFNKTTEKSYLYLYRICHTSSTSETQYKAMISAIGQYDENLLYEQDPKYLNGRRIYNSAYRSLYSLFASIADNKSILLNSFNAIYNNPLSKEKRVVVQSTIAKRQNSRSIIKNARSPKQDTEYCAQIVQYYDFGLNRYLVHMLRFSLVQLKELESNANNELKKNKGKLEKVNSLFDEGSKRKHILYQRDVLNRRIDILTRFLNTSGHIQDNINKILISDAFKGVEPSPKRDSAVSFYSHYSNIERRLFLLLFQGFAFSAANSFGSILASPIKQTSKLFEAYCLFAIDAAITELGFINTEQEIDYDNIIKRYVRDDYQIDLLYAIDAKDVSLVKKNEVYYISKKTTHVSPDFHLILSKKNMAILYLVMDAKCRRQKSIHESIKSGKYEETIRDYLSLRYSVDDNPFFLPKIADSIWLLFPNDGFSDSYEKINQLEYRFLKLKIDGDEDDFIEDFQDEMSLYIDD